MRVFHTLISASNLTLSVINQHIDWSSLNSCRWWSDFKIGENIVSDYFWGNIRPFYPKKIVRFEVYNHQNQVMYWCYFEPKDWCNEMTSDVRLLKFLQRHYDNDPSFAAVMLEASF